MTKIPIRNAYIELSALLKLAGLVNTGGEAKVLIRSGQVSINGQVEYRKGRKVLPGEQVETVGKQTLLVVLEGG